MTAEVDAAPVVIVGAGPVGLLLACELARAAVPVLVLEQLHAPMQESRASQLSTRTAELLHERGFGHLLEEATRESRGHFAGFPLDLGGLDSPFAGNWKIAQYRTEAVLAQRAQELGVVIARGRTLTGLEQHSDHVLAQVREPQGHEPQERVRSVRARFLIGCDGAGSTVRHLGGFPVSATAPTRRLLRADLTGISLPERRFQRLPNGFATAVSRDGVTRVMMYAASQPPVAEDEGFYRVPAFAEVVRTWREVTGEDLTPARPLWLDSFHDGYGQADTYCQGRVFLAGDAARWHMPIGGQALNAGLQDAVNLGSKLAAVSNGHADPDGLERYHQERHRAGAHVLAHVAAQALLLFGDARVEPLRELMREVLAQPQARAHLERTAGNLDQLSTVEGRMQHART
ncbi:FAD-dependent monooxygenase [Kineosporia babensis]|uniref:FAD-dependent monooxygenase n=1 Tax=Kineosporia babensis TaxID=499548 RepID=A0A9X1NIK2_9ACTN|nr:FAD-dependent monooxygenase [Kineosporia babensis]